MFCFSLTSPNQPRLKLQMAVVFNRNSLMNSLYTTCPAQHRKQTKLVNGWWTFGSWGKKGFPQELMENIAFTHRQHNKPHMQKKKIIFQHPHVCCPSLRSSPSLLLADSLLQCLLAELCRCQSASPSYSLSLTDAWHTCSPLRAVIIYLHHKQTHIST